MTRQTITGAIGTASVAKGARLTALALSGAAAFGLAACEEHSYPSAAPQERTMAPPPGDASLAGAPTTRSPDYVPPAGPDGAAYPPPYGPRGEAPPPPGYPPAYGRGAPPQIITMAPIPNPPEEPVRHGWRRHRHYRYVDGRGYVAEPYDLMASHHRHHHLHRYGPSPWVFHPAGPHRRRHHHHHLMHTVAPAVPAHGAAPAAHAPRLAPHPAAPQLTKPKPPEHHKHHPTSDAATAAAASGGSTNTMAGNSVATGSEADHYQSLQQGLQTLFASAAQFQTPSHLNAGETGIVSLTLPADFAQNANAEATKDGLGQAASSLNVMASLSGDGYTIVPADAQSLPLAVNTPTVFQWKVTPTGASRGALKVSAKAQAPGDSHVLDLGGKTSGSGMGAGKLVGLGLLAVIVVAVLGWFAQRRRPRPTGAARPRSTHTNGSPT